MIAETVSSGMIFLKSSLSLIHELYKLLDFAAPKGRNIAFSYPAQEMEVSMLLSIPPGPKRWVKNKIHLNFPGIKSISLKNLPLFTDSNAIIPTEQGYYLDTEKLGYNETFLLIIKHNAPREVFRDLISVQNSDTPINIDNGIEEYWLSAALKRRDILREAFTGFNMYGFESHLKISVHNSVAITIPNTFIRRLINISNYINATDREKMNKITYERLHQQREKKKREDERKIIVDLKESFCTSDAFLKFIKIDNPFIYREAIQGQNYYETIPFDVFPKTMDVVSATNIDFEHPTAQGKLYFKRFTFEDGIKDFFKKHGYIE